ncbi:MAG: phosphatidate cytidylyltransferase [Planctomycetota bacterium]
MQPAKRKSMATRVVFGVLLIGLVVGLLALDGALADQDETLAALPLGVVAVALVLVAFVEMVKLLATRGVRALWLSGCVGTVALATLPVWWRWIESRSPYPDGFTVLIVLSFALLAIFIEQMIRGPADTALLRIAATALTMLYLGVGLAMLLAIRLAYQMPMLVLVLTAVKATDIGAYFAGSLVGRHKLVPAISPGKSWEGLFGGLAFAAITTVAAGWLLEQLLSPWTNPLMLGGTIVFAVALGLTGQLGDLCESLLKRSAHVKDSGAVVPQFGGVLDIIDSPLMAGPVALVLLAVLT